MSTEARLESSLRLDRRGLLVRGLALALGTLPGGSVLAACGEGGGMMGRRMPDWMMSGGQMMDAEMMQDMRVIHELLSNHDRIRRRVEDVARGIRARTTSPDRAVAELIRTHVWQMKARVEEGDPIRHMDPLFREIFEHHTEVEMQVQQVPTGVLVTETSADPQVELLIHQHAHRAVSEFVAEGMARAMRPTPLPAGYRGGQDRTRDTAAQEPKVMPDLDVGKPASTHVPVDARPSHAEQHGHVVWSQQWLRHPATPARAKFNGRATARSLP